MMLRFLTAKNVLIITVLCMGRPDAAAHSIEQTTVTMRSIYLNTKAASGENINISLTNTHLFQQWVEIREESNDGRIVLRPVSPEIPPARGRRRLDLRQSGSASTSAPGPDDALESHDGSWKLSSDGNLEINAPGWTGTYRVIEILEEKLVIEPR